MEARKRATIAVKPSAGAVQRGRSSRAVSQRRVPEPAWSRWAPGTPGRALVSKLSAQIHGSAVKRLQLPSASWSGRRQGSTVCQRGSVPAAREVLRPRLALALAQGEGACAPVCCRCCGQGSRGRRAGCGGCPCQLPAAPLGCGRD